MEPPKIQSPLLSVSSLRWNAHEHGTHKHAPRPSRSGAGTQRRGARVLLRAAGGGMRRLPASGAAVL